MLAIPADGNSGLILRHLMMNKIIFAGLLSLLCYSCSKKPAYSVTDYRIDYDGVLDTILPRFADLKTLTEQTAYSPQYRKELMQHKIDRQYEWMHYTEKNGYSYFMVSRLQPSMNRDKYLAICGRFRRDGHGNIDTSSYEELFWTWKMKMDSLRTKSDILFSKMVETGDIDQYTPEKSKGFWIEFPSKYVYYDKTAKTWKSKPSY
jgi:hypothetical protein